MYTNDTNNSPDVPGSSSEAPATQPHGFLWLWYLYFRPSIFFPHFVVKASAVLTALAAFLYAVASTIGKIEVKAIGEDPSPVYAAALASWVAYWTLVGVAGVIGGLLYYSVGGWWYRVRLRWSGATNPEPRLARRVYVYASVVAALPSVLAATLDTVHHATPRAAFDADATPGGLLLMIFPFWSCWITYAGGRAVFSVKRGLALLWFFILPSALYALGFVIALAAGLLQGLQQAMPGHGPEPNLAQLAVFENDALQLSYPGNWSVLDESDVEEQLWTAKVSPPQDASFIFEVHHYGGTHAAIADDAIGRIMDKVMSGGGKAKLRGSFDRWGSMRGEGRLVDLVINDQPYTSRVFATPLNDLTYFKAIEIYMVADEDTLRPALGELRHAVKPRVPPVLDRPQTEEPKKAGGEYLAFAYPGNWEAVNESSDSTGISWKVEPMHDGLMRLELYGWDDTTAAAADETIDRYSGVAGVENVQDTGEFIPWDGFTGATRSMTYEYAEVNYRLRVWVVPLGDDDYLEAIELCPLRGEAFLEPGFRLVRESIRVEGERPAGKPAELRDEENGPNEVRTEQVMEQEAPAWQTFIRRGAPPLAVGDGRGATALEQRIPCRAGSSPKALPESSGTPGGFCMWPDCSIRRPARRRTPQRVVPASCRQACGSAGVSPVRTVAGRACPTGWLD